MFLGRFYKVCVPLFLSSLAFAQVSPSTGSTVSYDLPEIPNDTSPLSSFAKVREQLELIKNDAEQKMARLQEAKKAYDDAKNDALAQQKKIAEDRKLLDETLQKEKTLKNDRVQTALEFIGKMDPKKAAPVMETMDRDLVIILMTKLQPSKVTKILELMTPAKATQYLEFFTRIRSGREFDLMKDLGLCGQQKDE